MHSRHPSHCRYLRQAFLTQPDAASSLLQPPTPLSQRRTRCPCGLLNSSSKGTQSVPVELPRLQSALRHPTRGGTAGCGGRVSPPGDTSAGGVHRNPARIPSLPLPASPTCGWWAGHFGSVYSGLSASSATSILRVWRRGHGSRSPSSKFCLMDIQYIQTTNC